MMSTDIIPDCAGALGNPSPMMFIKTSVLILLATAIGQADARRRMFATQERHSTDNIAKLRDYYGTGTKTLKSTLWHDLVKAACKREVFRRHHSVCRQ